MNTFLELVKTRRSVRTFDGERLSEDKLNELKEFSGEIKNPYGIPIRFCFLDQDEHHLSSPVLSGEKLYVSAIVEKGEHAEEAYGYSFEKLLIRAHEMGLGTVWIGGTMPRDKFEKASGVETNEIMPCMSPLGGIAQKMSVKETMMRKGVGANNRIDFGKLFYSGDFDTPLTEDEAKTKGLYEALECVRVAPSAVNKQPWRVVVKDNAAHFYLKHDKGYITDDYDLQKVDVGIGMYHFEAGLAAEGKTLRLEVNDPGITTPDKVDYIATLLW